MKVKVYRNGYGQHEHRTWGYFRADNGCRLMWAGPLFILVTK